MAVRNKRMPRTPAISVANRRVKIHGPNSNRPIARRETASLIRESIRRVRSVARSYSGRGVEIDELIAAGNLGLAEAVHRFDPMRNVKLTTYADSWIRKRIREALAEQSGPVRLPRYQRDKLRDIYAARRRRLLTTGEPPNIERIAHEAGMSRAEVERLLQLVAGSVSLDQPNAAGPDPRPIGDLLADDQRCSPQVSLFRQDEAAYLRKNLGQLGTRERRVLSLRYGLGGRRSLTLREVGQSLGISREGVRQVEVRAIEKLRRRLGATFRGPRTS